MAKAMLERAGGSVATRSKPSILCVGEDPVLLNSRAQLLMTLGAGVHWAMGDSGALLYMAENQYALVILCHSLKETDALVLTMAARSQQPPALVLQIVKGPEPADERARIGCDALVETDPALLMDCVRRILSRQAGAEARAAR